MKILAWNLNHRTQLKKIPDSVLAVFAELQPDVITLNEYTDRGEREDFKAALAGLGYGSISVSQAIGKHNQVLIASKEKHEAGSIEPPRMDDAKEDRCATTNFHHVVLPGFDMEIVAFRVPYSKKAADRREYWTRLQSIIESTADRKIMFIGDFNCDPQSAKTIGSEHINALARDGWSAPSAKGDWSYISHDGKTRSRLDHVLGSPALGSVAASYITEAAGHLLAGVHKEGPISDHAVLLAEFS